jgi:hypothetical protein
VPDSFFVSATHSASVFAGTPGWTVITLGKTTPMVSGAMSRFGS